MLYSGATDVRPRRSRMSSELSPAERASPPRWARNLDLLCLVLAGLALAVAGWGGFRERVGGVRIALTSPYRLLLAAAALTVLRHVLAPRPSILIDLPRRIAAAWKTPAGRAASLAF